jgi:hypothetical protein
MTTHLNANSTRFTMRRRGIVGLALLLLAAPVACDTNVSNPGPVEDKFLDDRNAAAAMVNGAGRALSQSINWIGYTGAAVTREIHPAGSTGSFGISNRWQAGELGADDSDLDTHWGEGQRARWVAEEAVRRLEAAGPPPTGSLQTPTAYYNTLQLAYLYAGFANRVLGENMCDGVIDGSGKLDYTIYLTRAESLFTKAIAVTGGTPATITNQATAAYAGRAQVRLYLKKYPDALSDAAQVGIGYSYSIPYFNLGDDAQRNRIAWAIGNSPYRAHTEWNTWYYDYSQATNDPRVPITITTLQGDAAINCCGKVPFYPEAKYTNSASPIRLAGGREMRLIEAEIALRGGDVPGAVASMNLVRTTANAGSTVSATTSDEAWTLLKRERGIELWLESRRLGDMRRWKADNTPGTLDPLEQPGAASHLTQQDLCFPISTAEVQTNPNLQGS